MSDGSATAAVKSVTKPTKPKTFTRTDAGNAQAFATTNKDDLRFDHRIKRWMVKEQHWWREEDKGQTMQRAIATARKRLACSDNCKDPDKEKQWAIESEALPRLKAMIAIAESCYPLNSAGTEWDTDPWALGTPTGIYDLRTGQPYERDQPYITKLTLCGPSPLATCPLWLDFISKITHQDPAFASYLQRFAGYCLTGNTYEHAMQFLYGFGSNGKTTYLNVLLEIMRDYAHVLPIRVLTASRYESHPTELADLIGKRLVVSSETEDGKPWKESLLKGMVSGDPMSARKMRRDAFIFTPMFKIIVAGNDIPHLSDVKEADRRRYQIVPFNTRFKDAHDEDFDPLRDIAKDKTFMYKLRQHEYPAILRWMLNGCLMWHKEGLNPPKLVTSATKAYMLEQDALALWLNQHCAVRLDEKETTRALYTSWREWCDVFKERPGERRQFTERMKRRGFEVTTVGKANESGLSGVRLKTAEEMLGNVDADIKGLKLN